MSEYQIMRTKTGIDGLDGILSGGLPENRATLITGGPGAGKSTVAMQFLQTGLDAGENCLYISTEQTVEELKDSFDPYRFEIEHENLMVTSVHATPGHTIESGETEVLTIETLDGEASLGNGFSAPFTPKYIAQLLKQHAPCERIVFDSISGLAAMSDQEHVFRRAVLDMIRLFTDEFEATSLFVAEGAGSGENVANTEALQFNTHGVISLTREKIRGDYHRFLRVRKMRGVDHDTRKYELEFWPDGVKITPNRRTRSQAFMPQRFLSTGIEGLDRLCQGFIEGGTALLEHDGRADVNPMIVAMITEAVERDETIVLFPSANMEPSRFDDMLPETIPSVETLIAENRLFVLDFVGAWQGVNQENVFSFGQSSTVVGNLIQNIKLFQFHRIMGAVQQIHEKRGDRSAFAVLHTESLLQQMRPEEVRQMYYWAKQNLLKADDRVLFVQNPGVMDETLAEFYAYDSQQILRTWLHEEGLQYVRLEKSPSGELGSSRLVKYTEKQPYVAVQQADNSHRKSQDLRSNMYESPRGEIIGGTDD